jgi:hypothetical protein
MILQDHRKPLQSRPVWKQDRPFVPVIALVVAEIIVCLSSLARKFGRAEACEGYTKPSFDLYVVDPNGAVPRN